MKIEVGKLYRMRAGRLVLIVKRIVSDGVPRYYTSPTYYMAWWENGNSYHSLTKNNYNDLIEEVTDPVLLAFYG